MPKYQRVTLQHRIEIQASLRSGLRIMDIAKVLGFHKTTIWREIKRHQGRNNYQAIDAAKQAQKNFSRCRRRFKLQGELLNFTLLKLVRGWSPDQIERRLIKENSAYRISSQTIYRQVRRMDLKKTHLHFGYKRRGFGRSAQVNRLRGSTWKTSIHERCRNANERAELGHWERDTMFDQKKKSILVLTDRKSRFTVLAKNATLKAREVAQRTTDVLKKLPVETITNDNGSEFFDIKTLKVPVYFCDVLKPGQRGTVENMIGLLRRFLKREQDFTQISPRKLRAIQDRINHRPRKCLDYRTPYEVFYETNVALAM